MQVYCLIASQDSSTNIEIAQSSREIAEQSHKENGAMRSLAELGRQDNELMIQIARDSRAVALAAAQDSAAMQVIAAVTMLFLPATFTAVSYQTKIFKIRRCLLTMAKDILFDDLFQFPRLGETTGVRMGLDVCRSYGSTDDSRPAGLGSNV